MCDGVPLCILFILLFRRCGIGVIRRCALIVHRTRRRMLEPSGMLLLLLLLFLSHSVITVLVLQTT